MFSLVSAVEVLDCANVVHVMLAGRIGSVSFMDTTMASTRYTGVPYGSRSQLAARMSCMVCDVVSVSTRPLRMAVTLGASVTAASTR